MVSARPFAFLLLFVCLLPATLLAQDVRLPRATPESVGLSSDSLANMTNHFHQLVDEGQLAGVQTAVMRHGKLALFDSYGYGNIAEKTALTNGSLFRIFSMTKPIVSVALMQLYEAGKFQLRDPLHQFLPEFKELQVYRDSVLVPAQHPITILDLLRHSSGYSYGRSSIPELDAMYAEANLFAAKNNEEFIQRLSTLPLQFEPGTDWQYGVSTNVCGRLIEVLSGQPLDVYLHEHILDPLGMGDTHFQVPSNKVERFTVGYGWQDSTGLTIVEPQRENRYVEEVTLLNGGGGLVSSTEDYLTFCQMLLNKGSYNGQQLLQPATVALMLQDHCADIRQHQERLRLPYGEASFGLGFAVRGESPEALEPVFGWGGAVGTYFKIDTANNMAYVLMIQRSPYRGLGLRQLVQQYVEAAVVD